MSVEVTGSVSVADTRALVAVLLQDAARLSGSDASAQLSEVSQLAGMVDALRVALVARIESSGVWREQDPNATAVSFLRSEHTLDHREAKAVLRAVDVCEQFPQVADACRDGSLSAEKLDVISSIGTRSQARQAALPEFVDAFVALAPSVTTLQLRHTLDMWADQVDPATTADDDADAHSRRELNVSRFGNGVKLDGFFGKDQGLRLMTALNGVLDRQRRGQLDPNNTGHFSGEQITNSTATQRADAFIEGIINPVLEAGLVPTSGGSAATICVTVPLERLENPGQQADLEAVKTRVATDSLRHHTATLRATNGPGEALISTTTAQRMSCDATVQRVVLDPAGKPLDIGRKTRVIPEHIRTALIIRDGGCRFPYCTLPAAWAQGHHIQHWAQGGPTKLDNLILLCSKHHHKIHDDNIPITLDKDGKPRVHLEHLYKDKL